MTRGLLFKATVGMCALAAAALAGTSWSHRAQSGGEVLLAQSSLEAPVQSGREAPLVLDFKRGVQAELVGLNLVKEIVDGDDGRRMSVNEENLAKSRLAVATIKITKPAGTQLTLACADLTLHYYHGETAEVAPCEGMSPYTTALDADREISLSFVDGPGFLKKVTATRATEAAVVYIDAVFGGLEPDTREAWIAIGQVFDRNRPFISQGWTP